MITSDEKHFFDKCVRDALSFDHKRDGIGTLGERTLHRILKCFLEPDTAFHEVRLGRYVADICRGDEVIEIQTRSFRSLRGKLAAYRGKYRVTVVFPIAETKYITWVDPQTGELSDRHKSPKRGKPWDMLYELYALRMMMPLENVRFMLVFMNMDEFKLLSGRSHDKKRFGAARCERIPTELCDIRLLEAVSDFSLLIPSTLGDSFTAAEFAKAAKMTATTAGYAVRTLVTLGVIEHTGNNKKAYIYTRKDISQ